MTTSSPLTMRSRTARLVGGVGAGVILLAGCGSSAPSDKRVALEVVETLESVSDDDKQCMRDKIEGYENAQLEAMVTDDNGDPIAIDFTSMTAIEEASPDLRAFIDDLASCL